MTPDLLSPVFFFVIKILILVGLSIYAIFSFVIVRQEYLMAKVLEERFEPLLRLLTYIHLFLSLALTLFAFVIL